MTVKKFTDALMGQKIVGVGIRNSRKPRGFIITHLILENGEAYLFKGPDKDTDAMITEGKWVTLGDFGWDGYLKSIDSGHNSIDCEVWSSKLTE